MCTIPSNVCVLSSKELDEMAEFTFHTDLFNCWTCLDDLQSSISGFMHNRRQYYKTKFTIIWLYIDKIWTRKKSQNWYSTILKLPFLFWFVPQNKLPIFLFLEKVKNLSVIFKLYKHVKLHPCNLQIYDGKIFLWRGEYYF